MVPCATVAIIRSTIGRCWKYDLFQDSNRLIRLYWYDSYSTSSEQARGQHRDFDASTLSSFIRSRYLQLITLSASQYTTTVKCGLL